MKKIIKCAICLLTVACLLAGLSFAAFAAGDITATPSGSTFLVDGKTVGIQAYTIEGSNYVKLRDIAMALNGTPKQFDVGYDASRNAVTLTSGRYVPVGGELAKTESGASVTARLSPTAVYVDTLAADMTSYLIGGSSYFKLRDVANAVNFGIFFDGAANTITLDTAALYMPSQACGMWLAGDGDEAMFIQIYKTGKFTLYESDKSGNSKIRTGSCTFIGDRFSFVYDYGGETYTYDYNLKTVDGKTVLLLTGNADTGPVTLTRQDKNSVIGAWSGDSGTGLVQVIYYGNGVYEAGTLELSKYIKKIVGNYTVSGHTLTMSDPNQLSVLTFDVKSEGGKTALILTDKNGKTVTLYQL